MTVPYSFLPGTIPKAKKPFWHSSAHVLAQAILHFYPDAKLTIGPAIEKGFYYDVDFGEQSIGEGDFAKIEQQMLEFARAKSEFKLRSVTKAEALKAYRDNPFKTELISNLEDGTITFCDHADFTDLCRGGHLPHTGYIKAVKIMNVAGAIGEATRIILNSRGSMGFPSKRQVNSKNI